MAATRDDLLACLDDLGIVATTYEHPPVFTVEEAKRHCGHLPGGHCKSLFLKDKKKRLWLVVTLDHRSVDLKTLANTIGAARLSFGQADLLYAALGVTPGSVTPFALINDRETQVAVVLDRAMMELELVNFHPLKNDATTTLAPDDLLTFIAWCGHKPQLVDFGPLS
jgi:Ala-tRNA(Pro) deacylase